MNVYRIYVNVTAAASSAVIIEADSEAEAQAVVIRMAKSGHLSFDWEHINPACDRVELLAEENQDGQPDNCH